MNKEHEDFVQMCVVALSMLIFAFCASSIGIVIVVYSHGLNGCNLLGLVLFNCINIRIGKNIKNGLLVC